MHRDLKPANIMLDTDFNIKIVSLLASSTPFAFRLTSERQIKLLNLLISLKKTTHKKKEKPDLNQKKLTITPTMTNTNLIPILQALQFQTKVKQEAHS